MKLRPDERQLVYKKYNYHFEGKFYFEKIKGD